MIDGYQIESHLIQFFIYFIIYFINAIILLYLNKYVTLHYFKGWSDFQICNCHNFQIIHFWTIST